jgi:hypothetical protein
MPERSHASTVLVLIIQPKEPAMHEPIACPQCGAPAWITERFSFGSTAGPVEHVKTGCVNNHWLTPLAETIEASTTAEPAEVAAPLPA